MEPTVLSSWERGPQDIVVATPDLTTQYCGTSPQFDSTVSSPYRLWLVLILVALVLILIEWRTYHRRMTV